MWKLLVFVVACDTAAPPAADASIHLVGDRAPDAGPDGSCAQPGDNDCCALLPDQDAARTCFAAELPDGKCAELVCGCGVVAACHLSDGP